MPEGKQLGWRAISYGAGAVAGLVTHRVVEKLWRGVRHGPPPPVPADRHGPLIEALSWAVATGVGMGISRLLAVRGAAVVLEAATHEVPPDPGLGADSASS
jgi:Protein of unknown function (DUF4235)